MHRELEPGTTALVMLIPEADAVVGSFRSSYDPVAPQGMPAHVTILFPFLRAPELSDAVERKLRRHFTGFGQFRYEFRRTRSFPGVLILVPEDDVPFLELMLATSELFPDIIPYGDATLKPTPHLTVAHVTSQEELELIRESVEGALEEQGAIRGVAEQVTLIRYSGAQWESVVALPLGGVRLGHHRL
mgnify:CR=1 FL=1